jgi:broad specificity phosphatase PhoE
MKYPETLSFIRHDISAYNVLNAKKDASPVYREFKKAYDKDPDSDESHRLAIEVKEQFLFPYTDRNTPLAEGSGIQAEIMGQNLKKRIDLPDVIFVSPYKRTIDTLEMMTKGWSELGKVKTIIDERIIEKDYGLFSLYNDWRIFNVLYPDQRDSYKMQGSFWHRFPQGENIPDVIKRLCSFVDTLNNYHPEENVLAVTHHLSILALRSIIEGFSEKDFLRLNNEEKPINAGVTIYRGKPNEGTDGRLVLDVYNAKFY